MKPSSNLSRKRLNKRPILISAAAVILTITLFSLYLVSDKPSQTDNNLVEGKEEELQVKVAASPSDADKILQELAFISKESIDQPLSNSRHYSDEDLAVLDTTLASLEQLHRQDSLSSKQPTSLKPASKVLFAQAITAFANEASRSEKHQETEIQDTNDLLSGLQKQFEAPDLSALVPGGQKKQTLTGLSNKLQQQEPEKIMSAYRVNRQSNHYVLYQGSTIEAILKQTLSTELPSRAQAQVFRDVYNSLNYSEVLIPRGTEILGKYQSETLFGQNRIFVIWTRLIFPNGNSLQLDNAVAAGTDGKAGLSDLKNNRFLERYGGASLFSIFSGVANHLSTQSDSSSELLKEIKGSANDNYQLLFQEQLQRLLDLGPILTARVGLKFTLSLTRDIVFDHPYYEEAE